MKHERVAAAEAPPQDIPFWPDFINRELGGQKRWVLAPRLTPRLERDGHEVAIHPKKYADMERRWRAEVTEAVRLQMVALVGETATAQLLALPGLAIITDEHSREWPGTELEKRREERRAEHAAQVAAREGRTALNPNH